MTLSISICRYHDISCRAPRPFIMNRTLPFITRPATVPTMSSSTPQSASNSVLTAGEISIKSYIALLDCNGGSCPAQYRVCSTWAHTFLGDFGDTFWKQERKTEHRSNNSNIGSHTTRSNEATNATTQGCTDNERTLQPDWAEERWLYWSRLSDQVLGICASVPRSGL